MGRSARQASERLQVSHLGAISRHLGAPSHSGIRHAADVSWIAWAPALFKLQAFLLVYDLFIDMEGQGWAGGGAASCPLKLHPTCWSLQAVAHGTHMGPRPLCWACRNVEIGCQPCEKAVRSSSVQPPPPIPPPWRTKTRQLEAWRPTSRTPRRRLCSSWPCAWLLARSPTKRPPCMCCHPRPTQVNHVLQHTGSLLGSLGIEQGTARAGLTCGSAVHVHSIAPMECSGTWPHPRADFMWGRPDLQRSWVGIVPHNTRFAFVVGNQDAAASAGGRGLLDPALIPAAWALPSCRTQRPLACLASRCATACTW